MRKRGELLRLCLDRELYGDFIEDIAHGFKGLSEDEKEARAQSVIDLINSYQTESEIRAAARCAGLL